MGDQAFTMGGLYLSLAVKWIFVPAMILVAGRILIKVVNRYVARFFDFNR